MSTGPVRVTSRPAHATSRPVHDRRAGAAHTKFLPLVLGATGVVFGDIGTSPLYTFNSIFTELHAIPSPADVQQAFSVMFWTLVWMICVKYVGIVMRVSHHGEGGTFAMMKVILESLQRGEGRLLDSESETTSDEEIAGIRRESHPWQERLVLLLGMLSCSMLVGDGVITPPNSVLGALNSPCLQVSEGWNICIAVLIQMGVFGLQRAGSRVIGYLAGPIMVLWFLTIAGLGIYQMSLNPEMTRYIARGFNPTKVYHFFVLGEFRGYQAFRSIAGVVLCVTGAEALYADMGHFGAGAITTAWFCLVFPCLTLQYMGQAVILAQQPQLINANPLYSTAPEPLLWPVFILAALAAVIASQALISGVFTIMSQAHALGLMPRMLVLHTNPDEKGQVYIPEINWMMMIACCVITVTFKTSDNLVAAYGISVTGAFIFTTLLLRWVLREVWQNRFFVTCLVLVPMLAVDLVFWTANLLKIFDSGWVPLALSGILFLLMHSHYWGRNREIAHQEEEEKEELARLDVVPLQVLLGGLPGSDDPLAGRICTLPGLQRALAVLGLARSKGTGVFLTPKEGRVPRSLITLAKELGTVPRTVVLLHIAYSEEPFVVEEERMRLTAVDPKLGLWTATLTFGYAEPLTPARFDIHEKLLTLPQALPLGLPEVRNPRRAVTEPFKQASRFDDEGNLDADDVDRFCSAHITYVINRKHFVSKSHGCDDVYVAIFSALNRNCRSPVDFFGLTGQSVLEVSSVALL